MSRIEGITPDKKHQTVEDRRGAFKAHPEIHETHLGQKQKIALIAGISVVVLLAGWILLAQSGVLFPKTSSDAEFVESITEGFRNINTASPDTVNTTQDQQLLDQYDKELFPEFQE